MENRCLDGSLTQFFNHLRRGTITVDAGNPWSVLEGDEDLVEILVLEHHRRFGRSVEYNLALEDHSLQ